MRILFSSHRLRNGSMDERSFSPILRKDIQGVGPAQACRWLALLPLLAFSPCSEDEIASPITLNVMVPEDFQTDRVGAWRAQIEYFGGPQSGRLAEYYFEPGESPAGLREGIVPTGKDQFVEFTLEGLVEDPLHTQSWQILYRGQSGKVALNSAGIQNIDVFAGLINAFSPLEQPLSSARHWPTATTLPDGRVLLSGGADDDGIATTSADLFDDGFLTHEIASVPLGIASEAPRVFHTATLMSAGSNSFGIYEGKVGMNPLFIYLFAHTNGTNWLRSIAKPFIGLLFGGFGESTVQTMLSLTVWAGLWGICYFLYKRKVFIKL